MLKISLATLGLVIAGGVSQAADPPSLSGTWTGTTQGVGKEEGWSTDTVTHEITEQRGSAFIGHKLVGDGPRQDFFGTLAADGRTVHIVDGDGQNIGTF